MPKVHDYLLRHKINLKFMGIGITYQDLHKTNLDSWELELPIRIHKNLPKFYRDKNCLSKFT